MLKNVDSEEDFEDLFGIATSPRPKTCCLLGLNLSSSDESPSAKLQLMDKPEKSKTKKSQKPSG